ncbi:protein IWS1 homolog isoform X1 [Neltuma alba]|uniref:protein IWS1 homolog isoform X1 n=1 Tax=Neltuma alba TaxID=207710 RepID=UPI0010A546CA|nr:protein IWS1 homolog isoform X1 [Prosopis alba]
MGKSSASRKKKRSKKSLKVRTSGKSKSRRHTSKKLRRQREASLSISDYSDSLSSDTSLSSSPKDSYRSRKARSSKRKNEEGRRKMAKRHSYRHESSDDSHHDTKRKRAKRKSEQEARQKPYKKKKLRKEAIVGSMSNGSLSCSTCYGESASTDDNEPERHRGRVERKRKEKRPDRGRSESERSNRYRARSCSSFSFSGENSDQWTEEKYVSKNSSRRLKSVITVAEEAEETKELCHYETKEEIVDDYDYPSRSNDSNDGGSKRESDHHSLPTPKEKVGIEDTEVDRIAVSNLTEPERDQNHNNNSQFDRSEPDIYGAGTSESVEKKTSETSGASLDDEDLEAILRKRALENLRKFRGENQSSAKASGQKIRRDNDVIQPPIKSHEVVQGKSIVNNAGKGENFDEITIAEDINLATVRRKSVASSSEKENLNGAKGEAVPLKQDSAFSSEKIMDEDKHNETALPSASYASNNSGHKKLVVTENAIDGHASDPVHGSNGDIKNIRELCSATEKPHKEQDEVKGHFQFELKQTSTLDELHHSECPPTAGNVDQNAAKTHDTIQGASSRRDVDKPCVSVIGNPSSESSLVENSSNNLQGEASQGSQFEQKTMNVMRGGEMVQVSYKVYIPNKTPALARRKLKR